MKVSATVLAMLAVGAYAAPAAPAVSPLLAKSRFLLSLICSTLANTLCRVDPV